MNTYDVVYNEATRLHSVIVVTPAGEAFRTGHAYHDESLAWDYVFRCEANDRRKRY